MRPLCFPLLLETRENSPLKRRTVAGALAAALLLPALGLSAAPASAQAIERLGEFGNWTAYAYTDKGQKTCYMASAPTKDEGAYKKRGKIYTRVTHRPGESTRDEVSILAGYKYKDQSFVKVKIDTKGYDLFTHDDTAWAPDSKADATLVKAMKRGNKMTVSGASWRGTETKDTYSLSGFTKAYNAISKACPG